MMKRFFWVFLLVAALVACQEAEPTPVPTPRSLGGGVTEQETRPEPQISLSESAGAAGSAVLLSGREFPEGTFVEIRLSTTENTQDTQVLTTLQADEIGTFAAPLTMPTLWPNTLEAGRVELLITAETLTEPSLTVTAPYELIYEDVFRTYGNAVGGFSIDIPADWVVGDAQNTPLGTMFLLGYEPLTPGDPAVSTILISEELTAARAAEQLLCGGGCIDDVRLQLIQDDAEQTIYKTDIVSEGSPTLTWYFVDRDGRLIYWTLHDPVTYQSLDDLLNTLIFEPVEIAAVPTEPASEVDEPEEEAEEEEAEVTATAIPTEEVDTTAVPTTTATIASNTATPNPTPTDTSTPAPTSTPTNTPTPTFTPSATPTPTATVDPFRDLTDAGPVETATAFLLAIIREQIVTVDDAAVIFTEALLEERPDQEPLLSYMNLDRVFTAFNLARLQTEDVIVRVELVLPGGDEVERFVAFELGEDEVWRISGITAGEEEEEPGGTEEAGTPEAGGAGETEETPTPESTPEDGG